MTPASSAAAAVIRIALHIRRRNSIPSQDVAQTIAWATTLAPVAIAVAATIPPTPKGE